MKKARPKHRKESAALPDHFLLCRFDYARYVELCPKLRAATLPAQFDEFCTTPELQESLLALEEGVISPEIMRKEIVQTECCHEGAIELDSAFPRLVRELAQRRNSEWIAMSLSELIAGRKNIEPWLHTDSGFLGMLTPEEASSLSRSIYQFLLGRHSLSFSTTISFSKRKRRRGGLLGNLMSCLRSLFAAPPSDQEVLYLLDDLLRDAVRNGEGVALLSA